MRPFICAVPPSRSERSCPISARRVSLKSVILLFLQINIDSGMTMASARVIICGSVITARWPEYTSASYPNHMSFPTWPISGARERELLDEVLASDRWGGYHPIVARFEKEFAAFQHCRFGLSAMNGTVTLEMALEALGIGADDEVIVPAISFISTATCVSRIGATPVFVDIERDTFNIDPERVREAINPKTRAIIPVHFG